MTHEPHASISCHAVYEIVNDANSASKIPPHTTLVFYVNFGQTLPVRTAEIMWETLVKYHRETYKEVGYPPIYEFTNNENKFVPLKDKNGNFIKIWAHTDVFAGAWTHQKVDSIKTYSLRKSYGEIWGAKKFGKWVVYNYENVLTELRDLYGSNHLTIHGIHCLEKWKK